MGDRGATSCQYALFMLRARGLTWAQLAQELGSTRSRPTNLRTARMADLELTMRATHWLRRLAAEFVHPTTW